MFRLVQELAADPDHPIPAAVTCRAMKVSRSAFYAWADAPTVAARGRRRRADLTIRSSNRCRGAPMARRVHDELRLGLGLACGEAVRPVDESCWPARDLPPPQARPTPPAAGPAR